MEHAPNLPLFVYGTLLQGAKRIEVMGHDCPIRPARLAGYRMKQGRWPYLEAAPHAVTDGLLLVDLSTADYEKLDDYEDVAEGLYARETCTATVPEGPCVKCHVYIPLLKNWPEAWI